jgi:hypothetical protein
MVNGTVCCCVSPIFLCAADKESVQKKWSGTDIEPNLNAYSFSLLANTFDLLD